MVVHEVQLPRLQLRPEDVNTSCIRHAGTRDEGQWGTRNARERRSSSAARRTDDIRSSGRETRRSQHRPPHGSESSRDRRETAASAFQLCSQ